MKEVLIIGAGIAGLTAACRSSDLGLKVNLISPDYSERSQSVMAMGGINACLNTKGENDSVEEHFNDTMAGGVYINNRKAVKKLCDDAPGIVQWLSDIATSFTRDENGNIDVRYFGGQKKMRTAYAGARTGKQIVTALASKCRQKEIEGSVKRYVGWRFLSLIIEDDECRGAYVICEDTGEVREFRSDCVIIATGGLNNLFGKTSGSTQNDAYTTARLFTQGVKLANLEMIQYHPTTVKTSLKRMLITEAARGEGGNLYVMKDNEKFYFMKEWYPQLGELMPRDVVSRSIYRICEELNLEYVYLDVSHLPRDVIEVKLDEVCEVSRKYLGINPVTDPIPVYPGIHYFMGGIDSDENHKTNIKRLFAAGECSCQYHGANRLGGNSLLGAVHGGWVAACEAGKLDETDKTLKNNLPDNTYPDIDDEVSDIMNNSMGIYRSEDKLNHALDELNNIVENEFVILAKAMIKSALERKESRGAHQRTDFPQTSDEFKKTTIAEYSNGNVEISFREL